MTLPFLLTGPTTTHQNLAEIYASNPASVGRLVLGHTQAVASNKWAAQSNVMRRVVRNAAHWILGKLQLVVDSGLIVPVWRRIPVSLEVPFIRKCFRMYGGDDGARTRDLCRDRAAF